MFGHQTISPRMRTVVCADARGSIVVREQVFSDYGMHRWNDVDLAYAGTDSFLMVGFDRVWDAKKFQREMWRKS